MGIMSCLEFFWQMIYYYQGGLPYNADPIVSACAQTPPRHY
jgi:hypothetical protein